MSARSQCCSSQCPWRPRRLPRCSKWWRRSRSRSHAARPRRARAPEGTAASHKNCNWRQPLRLPPSRCRQQSRRARPKKLRGSQPLRVGGGAFSRRSSSSSRGSWRRHLALPWSSHRRSQRAPATRSHHRGPNSFSLRLSLSHSLGRSHCPRRPSSRRHQAGSFVVLRPRPQLSLLRHGLCRRSPPPPWEEASSPHLGPRPLSPATWSKLPPSSGTLGQQVVAPSPQTLGRVLLHSWRI